MLHLTRFCPWLAPAVLAALLVVPTAAQPPSPLELVRGLRENGQVELALEYLKDLEGQPLSADDKAALLLERAKCLLDASEDEPDEATRVGMVAEAKEGLGAFLIKHANHPRAAEAKLTNAKLLSLDAREQLNRARRMDIPPGGESQEERDARKAAQEKQREEAKRAEPIFLEAAKQFRDASALIRAKLDDKNLDPLVRRALDREAFEAELAAGINKFNTAETFMPAAVISGTEKERRNKLLEEARAIFAGLAKGPVTNRTVWVAKAWGAEVTFEQDRFGDAANEVAAILRAPYLEAEEGKRLARFFQLRRNYLAALSERILQKVNASEAEIRNWLRLYGNPRKPTPEVYAVRFYHARVLQSLAENSIGPPPKDGKPVTIGQTARKQLEEAEKLYRGLSQTEHDYTARASRQRMQVVRRLLGDAEQEPRSFSSFEKAQMASLIQLSKLAQAETMSEKTEAEKAKKEAAVKDRQAKVVALLERARDLSTPQDNPADVTDVTLRLIYFYLITGQPYQAAVLGEHASHTIKATGGKAALAGLFGVNGYAQASARVRGDDPEAVRAARAADRARAAALARFLDEKYPNDNPTDEARHRLASLLVEDRRLLEAFEVLTRVRPAYSQVNGARLLEGYLAQQIVVAKPEPGQETVPDARKAEVYQRALSDLAKVSKPAAVALEDDVRNYVSARCRLASLLFVQKRVDPAAEKASPGHNQALAIAEEVLGQLNSFNCLVKEEGGAKKFNLDGLEMSMLALDVQARAAYLKARALMDEADALPADAQKAKLDEAAKALQPILDTVEKGGAVSTAEMKAWAGATGADVESIQKARVGKLADAVDRTRIDAILAAFRLRVKQAQAKEAEALLNLMLKAGGSVQTSLPMLERDGRELAARMVRLRKEGNKAEADALGAGLAVLLAKIATVPDLPKSTTLFVGQMQVEVGKFNEAMETLKKIPEPEFKEWRTTSPDKMRERLAELKKQLDGQPKPDAALVKERDELEKQIAAIPMGLEQRHPAQMRDYAVAQLGIARALREGKKFDEAEKMLREIIGTPDKRGWGSGRLYFRKELATLYEDKGATIANPKDANPVWASALREWTSLFNLHRARLQKPPPNANMSELKNAFADAFFDVKRCLVKANQQLQKAQPAKLANTYADVAKNFTDMERQIPRNEWQPEVQHRYADFLKEVPDLDKAYRAAGGKLFLEKLPLNP